MTSQKPVWTGIRSMVEALRHVGRFQIRNRSIHASAAYRRRVGARLVARVLAEARREELNA